MEDWRYQQYQRWRSRGSCLHRAACCMVCGASYLLNCESCLSTMLRWRLSLRWRNNTVKTFSYQLKNTACDCWLLESHCVGETILLKNTVCDCVGEIILLPACHHYWRREDCAVFINEPLLWLLRWSIGDCVESLRAWESWSSELYWIYMPLIVDAAKLILILRWRLNEDWCVKTETVTALEIEWRLLREDRDCRCELRIHERLLVESLLSVYFRDLSLVNICS